MIKIYRSAGFCLICIFSFPIFAAVSDEHNALQQAQLAYNAAQYEQAQNLLEKWLATHWDDLNARWLLAQSLFALGKFKSALEKYEFLLEKDPENVSFLMGKAKVLLKTGDPVKAMPLLQTAKYKEPKNEEVWRLEIEIMKDAKNPHMNRLAHQLQKQAIALFPNSDWTFPDIEFYGKDSLEKAEHAIQLGRFNKAETFLRDWLQTDSEDTHARALLANALFQQKKLDDAIEEYNRLLKIESDNVDYLTGIAQVFVSKGDMIKGLGYIEKARYLDPENKKIWELQILALSKIKNKNISRLVEVMQNKARRRFPDSRWDLTTIGRRTPGITHEQEFVNTQIEAGYSYETVTNNYSNGKTFYIGGGKTFANDSVIYGYYNKIDSLGLKDNEFLLGTYLPISDKWLALVETTASTTHLNYPYWSLFGQLQLTTHWNLNFFTGLRHKKYTGSVSNEGLFSIDYYWKKIEVTYTFIAERWSYDRKGQTHQWIGTYYYSGNGYLSLGYADYNTTEFYANAEDYRYGTQKYTLSGLHWITNPWAIVYQLGVYKKEYDYTQRWATLGLRYNF